ncbi:MAG: ABC transporter permease, partial [Bacteroidota bacterium]|nr:ABC transporter permease [Bacteroidota bacterium]
PRHPIGNLTLVYAPERCQYLAINILPQNGSAIIAAAQPIFKKLFPETPFIYSWLDKELKNVGANSDMGAKSDEFSIVVFLAVMAITIACIGLLGIATYTARIRQKEVGIRKIMGASVKAIVMLLSKDFIKLLLIASAIALPAGYIVSSNFLYEFAYA